MLELDDDFVNEFHSALGTDVWTSDPLDEIAKAAGLVARFECGYAVVSLAFCRAVIELEDRWRALHGAVGDARASDVKRSERDYYLVIVVPRIPAEFFATVASIVNDMRVCRKIVLSADAEDVRELLQLCPFGDLNADATDSNENADAAIASQAEIEPTEETISELARLGDGNAFELIKTLLDKAESCDHED